MQEYEKNLSPEELNVKLEYIAFRWGVDKEMLDQMMHSPLQGIGKGAKRKFRRYLRSLESAFKSLSREYLIKDRFEATMLEESPHEADDFLSDYYRGILRELGSRTRFNQYLSGEWDDEILRAVSIAQRRHVAPGRLKTKIEQQPRARFEPP